MPVRLPRTFFQYAIQPLFPASALHAAAWLRGGRRLRGYVERTIPFWFDREFARESGLIDLATEAAPHAPSGVSRSAYEAKWIIGQPHFDRVVSTTAGFALEAGVESRIPLLDRRLIEFAMTRPWWERRSKGEDKHLIRHAMKEMLPQEVLAPRPMKTGSLGGYLGRALRGALPQLLDLTEEPVLAQMGIVDRSRLQHAAKVYRRTLNRDTDLGVHLLSTLQTELWLRARVKSERVARLENIENAAGLVA